MVHDMPLMTYSPLGAPDTACVMPCLHILAQHTVAGQPLLPWPGPSAAVRLLEFPNPAPWRI
jgi:hypothetical protein